MRALLLLLATFLATPTLAAPQRAPLTLLPVLAGEGVSEQEVAVLEADLRTAIERQRHFALTGPESLPPLGAHCRAELGCVRASLPSVNDALTLDLRVERLGRVLAVDLRLVKPAGPIERWRSTLTARSSSTVLREAVDVLLVPHTPDAYLFRRFREEGDQSARDLLLRNYPDSDYARALLRAAPVKRSELPVVVEPLPPARSEEDSPGSPEWIDYLDG